MVDMEESMERGRPKASQWMKPGNLYDSSVRMCWGLEFGVVFCIAWSR